MSKTTSSPVGVINYNTSQNSNFYHVTFRFLETKFIKLENPNVTEPRGRFKYQFPKLPVTLPFQKTNTIVFNFLLVNQDPTDPIKIVPNGNTSGEFVCESDLIPIAAPYVQIKAVLSSPRLSGFKKSKPEKARTDLKEYLVYYKLVEISKIDLLPGTSFDKFTLSFILEKELLIQHPSQRADIVKVCEYHTRINGQVQKVYNILKLKDHSVFSPVYTKYLSDSGHTMDKNLFDIISWCPNIKYAALSSSLNRALIIKFKDECLKDPIETYFFNPIIGNSRLKTDASFVSNMVVDLGDLKSWINLFSNPEYATLFNIPKTRYVNTNYIIIKQDIFLQFLFKNPEYIEFAKRIQKMIIALKKLNVSSSSSSQLYSGLDTIFYEPPDSNVNDAIDDLLKYNLIYRRVVPLADFPTSNIEYYKLHKHEWTVRIIFKGLKKIIDNFKKEQSLIKEGKFTDIEFNIVDDKELDGVFYGKFLSPFNDKQLLAFESIMTKKSPISCLTGGPGTGKTFLIKSIVTAFKIKQQCQKDYLVQFPNTNLLPTGNVLVLSYINTAASHLNEKGVEAYGIKALVADKTFQILSREFLINVKLVIIEEFSTFSEEIYAETLQYITSHCLNLIQIVHTYDSDQINPIEAGCPSKSIERVFIKNTIRLEKNFRVSENSTVLTKNAIAYQSTKPWFDVYEMDLDGKEILDIAPLSSMDISIPLMNQEKHKEPLTFIPESGSFYIKNLDATKRFPLWYLKNENMSSVLHSTQFICFQNVLIDSINETMDVEIRKKLQSGKNIGGWHLDTFCYEKVRGTPLASQCRGELKIEGFYTGQKLMFLKKIQNETSLVAKMIFLNRGGPGVDINCTFKTSSVINGKLVRIKSIFKYLPGLNEIHKLSHSGKHNNTDNYSILLECIPINDDPWENIVKEHFKLEEKIPLVPMMSTLKSKEIITDKNCIADMPFYQPYLDNMFKDSVFIHIQKGKGITPNIICPAWAISVDKYQGRQNDTVVLSLMPNDGSCFSKEHGYVALTRAKKRLIICGPITQLYRMAKKTVQNRHTDLDMRIRELNLF